MKPFLNVFGSSHAKRLAKAIRKNIKFTEKYNLVEITKPGAVFSDLTFPRPDTLREGDVLIIQLFGNELFEKRIKITKINGKRTIHLLKYCPINQSTILENYAKLKSKLENTKAQVFILDNIIRHTGCCRQHKNRRISTFQLKQNHILQKYFSQIKNVMVLDHKKFIGLSRREAKCLPVYEKLLVDSVHMMDEVYCTVVEGIRVRFGL